MMKAMAAKTTKTIGNFWQFLVVSCTRILLPLSLIVGFILILQGTPMGFDGKMKVTTLEGQEQMVSQGPAAAIIPIKQLGTNGGGYFGVNSSHPLENPTFLTNAVECWSILIIPMAMVFAFGFYVKRKKLAYSIFGVMLVAYLIGVFINVSQEMGGNPRIDEMGISQAGGAMEGKEVRIGAASGALAAQWYDRDVEYADQYLVWWCRCRLDELLHFYYYSSVYQWINGRAYTGIFRKESRGPRNENSDHCGIASSVCDFGRHGFIQLPVRTSSGVRDE